MERENGRPVRRTNLVVDAGVRGGAEQELVGSVDEMVAHIDAVLNEEKQHGYAAIAPEELLRVEKGVPHYFLRMYRVPFLIRAIRGNLPKVQFEGMIRAALIAAADAFGKQISGNWRPVAAEIKQTVRRRSSRVAREIPRSAIGRPGLDASGLPTQPGPQRRLLQDQEDQDLLLEVAFVDTLRSKPMDPLYEEQGRRDGMMRAYVDSGGQLTSLPLRLRQERERAVAIIQQGAKAEKRGTKTE